MAAAAGKRGCFREKQNLDSGPSLYLRKKCDVFLSASLSACRRCSYSRLQVSIIMVWRNSGHVVLFSEAWSNPDDLTELFLVSQSSLPSSESSREQLQWIQWKLQYSRAGSSEQTNHMFKNGNLWGKYHRNQQPGPRSGEAAAFTSGTTWHSAPSQERLCRELENPRTMISLLTWWQRPDMGFTHKAQQLVVSPSFTLCGTAWGCCHHCSFNILKVSWKLLSPIQDSLLLD